MRLYTRPMNYELAEELCGIYTKMTDMLNDILKDRKETVDAIVIAPNDMLNKWHFFNFYMQTRDNRKALSFYRYSHFDVIAIIKHGHNDGEYAYTYRSVSAILKLAPGTKVFYC